ncbi:hypothetical protein PVAND_000863 [Polypedilum vanderplanki]|uniref:BTB domain-containing protein n=1 Tax=Polypedilum vanderplanki TaxID=319348 RepID=A0A9J6BMI9_POLVA|nr:hypothetical protein PVAND_000863 [Polypedilum vanderplanki]
MEQQVKCNFFKFKWHHIGEIYTCLIQHQEIGSQSSLKLVGVHSFNKNNEDVFGASFKNCKISNIPKGLMKIFPNLTCMAIYDSELKSISRDDLKEYKNLKCLLVNRNNIAYLPGDLFQDLKELEIFSAFDSKIELIEPNIFDNCHNLKHVSLTRNICINKHFNLGNPILHNATLEEIKIELQNIYPVWGEKVKIFNGEITSEILKLIKELEEKKESNKNIKILEQKLSEIKLKFSYFENIMRNEELKDFTIKTEFEEFKAHKFVLAARSPTFADLIIENVHAECLNLLDVSTDVFRVILDFIYTDEFPENIDINFGELFFASERLKLENLKKIAAKKLLDTTNTENALEMLEFSLKTNNEELKKKSFEEIKKYLDFIKLDENLAFEPEKLKKLIEVQKEKERFMREFEESVKNILI